MDFTALVKNRIALSRIPFSERSSRIMVFRGRQPPGPGERPDDFFTIRLAEHWEKEAARSGNYPTRRSVVDDLVFIDAHGNPLPMQVTTYPQEVDVDTSVGQVHLCFADPETLFFALPSGTIGLRFKVRAARVSIARRGADAGSAGVGRSGRLDRATARSRIFQMGRGQCVGSRSQIRPDLMPQDR